MVRKIMLFCLLILFTPGLVLAAFVVNTDNTVTDTSTGLMWKAAPATTLKDWEGAVLSCEALEFAGHTDWRLPSRNELHSIVDYNNSKFIDRNTFSISDDAESVWTSTTYTGPPVGDPPDVPEAKAWFVNLTNGGIEAKEKSEECYVLAVRGGQVTETGVVITYPKQTSVWPVGNLMPIVWDKAINGAVLYVSRDGGKTWGDDPVEGESPSNTTFLWTVTGDESYNCMLKVVDGENEYTQGLFSITGSYPIDATGDGQIDLGDIIKGLQVLAGDR
ncbi:DUF1566 domain-containing protein [Desulfococcaceae bacterium HSG8]|nr:DUF1566 domain-containing protein [Desulfococcaceae bacterium HSG8]